MPQYIRGFKRMIGKISHKVFCAFCKIPRRVYLKKHIGFVNVFFAILGCLPLMYFMWGGFDARIFIIFTLFLCIGETFVLIRWRLSMKCPYCSFDPILYKKNRKLLIKNIQDTLVKARRSPISLLSANNPLTNLATRAPTEVEKKVKSLEGAGYDPSLLVGETAVDQQ